MTDKDRRSEKELELIKDKLHSLDDKIDSVSETLYALISITLDPPPNIEPTFNTEVTNKEESEKDTVDASAVDTDAIRPCKFKYIYIWSGSGQSFWAWLNYVGRRSASGFRWYQNRWVYFGIDLRQIDSFICY